MALLDAFTFKVLDISTGHMERADARRLELNNDRRTPYPAYELNEYGWLVYIGEIEDNWDEFSAPFRKVLDHAKDMGCEYVRFDRDGRTYEELEYFDLVSPVDTQRARTKATYGYWKGARWRGCPYVPFPRLTLEQQEEARKRFSPKGRREGWENIEWWAFCVRADGKLSKCPYIEPVGPPDANHLES